ncbi:MAG TPA: CBS domain-containing protein [Nakamurella sp.]|nr:CBS domain-containing protein [Nakamurella sp.]
MIDLATVRLLQGVSGRAHPVGPTGVAATGVDRPAVRVAGEVMTRDPDRVAGSDSLLEVAYTMQSLLVAFLPVCDQDGALLGIIALRDLPRVVRGADPAGVTASTLAEPAVTIGVDDPVDHVSELMAGQRMWLLPVLDGRRLVGVIHYAAVPGAAIPPVRATFPVPAPVEPGRATPVPAPRRGFGWALPSNPPGHRPNRTPLAGARRAG